MKTIEEIKDRANKNIHSSVEIVTSVSKNLNKAEIKKLPRFKSMIDKVRRIRNKPLSRYNSEFDDIAKFLQTDLNGKKFLNMTADQNQKTEL
jgi:hypothetical protein